MNTKHRNILFCAAIVVACSSGPERLFAGKGSGATGGFSLTEMFDDALAGSIFVLKGQGFEHRIPTYLGSGLCSDQDAAWLEENQHALKDRFEASKVQWVDTDVESDRNPSALQKDCVVASQEQFSVSFATCRPLVQNRLDAVRAVVFAVLEAAPFSKSRQDSQSVVACFTKIFDRDFSNYLRGLGDYIRGLNYMRDRRDPDPNPRRDVGELSDLLTSSREVTARSLENFANAVIPENADKSIISWLHSRSADGERIYTLLARDMRNSRSIVTFQKDAQTTCAHTDFAAAADVYFSASICQIFTRRSAIQTLVHESTHHAPFLVRDELLADRIGTLVAAIIESNPTTLYISEEEQKKNDAEEYRKFMRLYRILHPELTEPSK